MSKIICDVCGTSYPESATQCPICGCVRPVDTVTVNTENNEEATTTGTYTYVKGGRFSKANVKKRNSANHAVPVEDNFDKTDDDAPSTKVDKGLTITICVLLLAIIAVVVYIVLHFFAPNLGKTDPTEQMPSTTTQATTEDVTTEPTVEQIPCEQIIISNTVVELDKVGAAFLLNVTTDPDDTTDVILFESSDESVATVTSGGKIVAVAPGQAVITVSCGVAEAQCRVVCAFEAVPDETTEATTDATEATEPETDTLTLKLNWTFAMVDDPSVGDVTLKVGETWAAYTNKDGKIPATEIVFKSSDTSVVTIDEKGIVKAVGIPAGKNQGEAMITAEYQGQIVKCRIIVR